MASSITSLSAAKLSNWFISVDKMITLSAINKEQIGVSMLVNINISKGITQQCSVLNFVHQVDSIQIKENKNIGI